MNDFSKFIINPAFLGFIILLVVAYLYFLQKIRFKKIKKRYSRDELGSYAFQELNDAIKILAEKTNLGFWIDEFTTICIREITFPLIYGSINHPAAHPINPIRSYKQTCFILTSTVNQADLLKQHPKVFLFGCRYHKWEVYSIKNIKLLTKLLS